MDIVGSVRVRDCSCNAVDVLIVIKSSASPIPGGDFRRDRLLGAGFCGYHGGDASRFSEYRFNTGTRRRRLGGSGLIGNRPPMPGDRLNGHHTAVTLPDGTPVSSGEGGGVVAAAVAPTSPNTTHHVSADGCGRVSSIQPPAPATTAVDHVEHRKCLHCAPTQLAGDPGDNLCNKPDRMPGSSHARVGRAAAPVWPALIRWAPLRVQHVLLAKETPVIVGK